MERPFTKGQALVELIFCILLLTTIAYYSLVHAQSAAKKQKMDRFTYKEKFR